VNDCVLTEDCPAFEHAATCPVELADARECAALFAALLAVDAADPDLSGFPF
jgi:hypothetical protein